MDHCFPKKGLTLSSRQHVLFSQNNSNMIPKMNQKPQFQFNRTLPQNVNFISQPQYPKPQPQPQQFLSISNPVHQRTLSANITQSPLKSQPLNLDSNLTNQLANNRKMPQQLNPPNQNSQFKFFSFQQMQQNLKPLDLETQQPLKFRATVTVQQTRPLAELSILPQNFDIGRYEAKSPTNKLILEMSRMASPRQEIVIKPVKANIEEIRIQKDVILENNGKVDNQYNEQLVAQQKRLEDRIQKMQKQNQQLMQQVRKHQIKNQSIEDSKRQKENLVKLLEEKDRALKEQKQNYSKKQYDYISKLNSVQQQIRMLKGNKNRLQIQVKNHQKLFKSQRQKNEKTREQFDKLIFFQQDLIHAKDYSKLKDQIQCINLENNKMFEQHQQFIIETTEYRKKAEESITQLQKQIKDIRLQNQKFQDKITVLTQCGEDKLIIIKLQNQLNFLAKKIQQQKHTISQQQKHLKQSIQLRAQQNQNKQNSKKSQSILDQISIRQIQDTISLYQARLSDMSELVAKKQAENINQKRTLDLLTTQLRRSRQQKHINAMKQKSNQNNVKNLKGQVQAVQRTYQIQLQLKNKKLSNLQESIQRKTRQIVQKDKFIKQFLLSRLKGLENTSLETINQQIKEYFEPITSNTLPQTIET